MRHLQEVDGRQATPDQLGVDFLLDVTGQQNAMPGELAEQDDRDVVDCGAAVGRVLRDPVRIRPQHLEPDAIQLEPIAGREPPAWWAAGRECCRPGLVSRARPEHPRLVDPADAIPREQRRQTGHVVLVGMGEDEEVNPAVPGRQALVECNEQPSRIGSAVDDQPATARSLDEDAVTLPDVEDDDSDDPVRAVGERQAEGDGRAGKGEPGEALAA